ESDAIVAAFALALGRYSAAKEFVIGYAAHSAPVAVQVDLREDRTLAELTARVRAAHAHAPDARFTVMALDGDGREPGSVIGERAAACDLVLIAQRQSSRATTLTLDYDAELFFPQTARQLLEAGRRMLEAIRATPGARCSEPALMSECDRSRIVREA